MADLSTDFTFTIRSDSAEDLDNGIFNDAFVTTGLGNDSISGSLPLIPDSVNPAGVRNENDGHILMSFGDDSITGNGVDGVSNDGHILMGFGNDSINGTGLAVGIRNNEKIDTGVGNDSITGNGGGVGIFNTGRIDMGFGNDSIDVEGSAYGIENRGIIHTGWGNDLIRGNGKSIGGILNDGTINTGQGNDEVIATSPDPFTGFSGSGSISLGHNDDLISGFGSQTVDGGYGFDRAEFDFDLGDVELGITDNTVVLTYDSGDMTVDMTLANIESFEFNDGTYSFAQLSDFV